MFLLSSNMVQASPWAAVGDMQLRNDVEILARYGIISGPVNTWPISWVQITKKLPTSSEIDLPPYVRLAVMRVKAKIPRKFRTATSVQATSDAAIVRGFAKTARRGLDADATLEYNGDSGTTLHFQGGYRTEKGDGYTHLDGSYISQDMGNWSLYAGAFDRWWGPGRESTLLLSNNARPMPSAGLRRIAPEAFKTKWLSWMGPWQWDIFVAKMEKARFIPHALVAGMRLSFEPINNFEVGLSRTLQLCGDNRSCGFKTWRNSFISFGNLDNTGTKNEPGNQLASIDLAYSMGLDNDISLKLYAEGTAEDQNIVLPFQYASLIGASLYGPYGSNGANWRFTTEYSDTIDKIVWLFGRKSYNTIYEHFIYLTGWRYKGRSLGHSLDNDSQLISLVAQYQMSNGWEYTAKYHRAKINMDGAGSNAVSTPALNVNIFEASVQADVGSGNLKIDLRHSSNDISDANHTGSFTSFGITWALAY